MIAMSAVAGPLDGGVQRATLQAAGLRVTPQRLSVLAALAGRTHSVTAIQLRHELHSAGAGAALTTVYRTLAALAEAGQVHRFDVGGEAAYSWCPGEHPHLRCEVCGWVRALEDDIDAERWIAAVAAREFFLVTAHHAEISGVCATCR